MNPVVVVTIGVTLLGIALANLALSLKVAFTFGVYKQKVDTLEGEVKDLNGAVFQHHGAD